MLGSDKASAYGIRLGKRVKYFFFLVKLSAREIMKREKVLFRVYMYVYICFKNAVTFWEISVHINVCLSVCLSVHLLNFSGFLKPILQAESNRPYSVSPTVKREAPVLALSCWSVQTILRQEAQLISMEIIHIFNSLLF